MMTFASVFSFAAGPAVRSFGEPAIVAMSRHPAGRKAEIAFSWLSGETAASWFETAPKKDLLTTRS
jgi:hypothetical protein